MAKIKISKLEMQQIVERKKVFKDMTKIRNDSSELSIHLDIYGYLRIGEKGVYDNEYIGYVDTEEQIINTLNDYCLPEFGFEMEK